MHPVFGLWIGLLVLYMIATGRAVAVVSAFQDAVSGKLKAS